MISDIGILVAIYYGATGIACAWAFRRVLLQSVGNLFLIGILPLIGGIFLFWIGYQVIAAGVGAAVPVLITLGLGIPLTVVAALVNKNGFFSQKTVAYDGIRAVEELTLVGAPQGAEEPARG